MARLYTNRQLARRWMDCAQDSSDQIMRGYLSVEKAIKEEKESIHYFYRDNNYSLRKLSVPGIGRKAKIALERILGEFEEEHFSEENSLESA